MSYIGNTPGVSSQRVVLEEVISGSPKSAFTPISGYTLGYLDVLVNGVEVDSADYTASDGVTVTLATAAAVGDTVKIKTWLPRGLSDGYMKSEADARYLKVDGSNYVTGNLGVGTNSVLGNSTLNAVLGIVVRNQSTSMGYFQSYNANAGADLKTWRFGGNDSGTLVFETVNDAYSAAASRMALDSSGRLMLGTSASNTFGGNLELVTGVAYNTSPNTTVVLGGTDNGYVDSGKASTYRFTVTGNATNQNLSIDRFLRGTGWTNSAVFDGAGNFSLGTTNTSNGRATIYNAAGNTLSLQKSNGAAALMFGSDTTNYALIESANGGGLNFYTGSGTQTVRASIDANGLNVNSRLYLAFTNVGNLASGSIASLPSGERRYQFSIQGDDVWRTLISTVNDQNFLMHVEYLSDAASSDSAMYSVNMTSPAYGVYTLAQNWYVDGGWNTGTFSFRFLNNTGNNMQLQVKYASYYSSSNIATGYIRFTAI